MPRFELFHRTNAADPIPVIANTTGSVLLLIERFEGREADVVRDGRYCFTARLDESGVWCILEAR